MDTRPLLPDLLAQIGPTDGQTANTLLSEFFRGRPIMQLDPALRSSNDNIIKQAVWITSELGTKAVELLPAVHHLLRHHSPYVRCLALDVVINCASTEHREIVATALQLLCDESAPVRKRAYYFTARGRVDALQSGIGQLQQEPHAIPALLVMALPWLFSSEAGNPGPVKRATQSSDYARRVVGILAAARLGPRGIDILAEADASVDEALQDFIRDLLEDYEAESSFERSSS